MKTENQTQPSRTPIAEVVPRGLGIHEAAQYLSVTVCFVRALITTGEIPYVIAGKRFILDRLDLDRWLESRKQTGCGHDANSEKHT
jgi:excisionase family DNA binding protein